MVIGVGAFKKCDKLEKITIPYDVKYIEKNGPDFRNSREVILSGDVKNIELNAFSGYLQLIETIESNQTKFYVFQCYKEAWYDQEAFLSE